MIVYPLWTQIRDCLGIRSEKFPETPLLLRCKEPEEITWLSITVVMAVFIIII